MTNLFIYIILESSKIRVCSIITLTRHSSFVKMIKTLHFHTEKCTKKKLYSFLIWLNLIYIFFLPPQLVTFKVRDETCQMHFSPTLIYSKCQRLMRTNDFTLHHISCCSVVYIKIVLNYFYFIFINQIKFIQQTRRKTSWCIYGRGALNVQHSIKGKFQSLKSVKSHVRCKFV